MRSRMAIVLVALLSLQSWAAVSLPEEARTHVDAWGEVPFRDIAVLEPFSHQTLADYSDVAVIINNQSEVSRTIGTAFAVARDIPPERVFLLTNESTPTGETINSNQFTTFFSEPISQMILDRNLTELNVLVTTKGVPLRVDGGTNSRAAFDSELALIDGPYAPSIFADWNVNSNYGPAAGHEMKQFQRDEQGYYLVTRLTGYDVETALGLIAKANNSVGQHGLSVLDLATNRNGSGYKWWNDLLYTTEQKLSDMGFAVEFNQNGTYVTGLDNVSMYAAWGSNDGSWDDNELANSGYDTSDGSWSTGSRYWDGIGPSLSADEQWWWARQTETKRNGNAAMEGRLEDASCGANDAALTNGLLAEYFDNNGITYNSSTMVNLSGRTPDFTRHEPNLDWPSTQSTWTGLDSRFLDYWSARHSGIIHVPTAGNWTFYLRSDDGSKLWIDGAEIVDNQGHHAMQERSGVVWLDAGEHRLLTEFFEHGGYAGLELKWEGPGISKQTVPNNVLTRGSSFPVREADLIHHWKFDETSGDVANDSVGSAHLNFTGTNGTQWRTCVLGNCAFFDGIDDEARIDVEDSVTDFTVSLWVQANHTGQPQHASAIAVNDVAGDDDSFQIQTGGGNPGDWELYHNNSYSFGTVDPTVWQHLVATFTNDTVTLFLDGVEVLNQSVPNGTVNSIEIYKFGVNRAGSTHFTGVIDE
ncbi:MAG: TIGR03790 family protein, partial [Candidatus Thalassarchaeaceae archaeon]|nr:TIGR03790 family protein [Candidatus Thalassarchaeaceae archaeon]